MSVELRNVKQNIFLIGLPNHQINGAKLPSNRQEKRARQRRLKEEERILRQKELLAIASTSISHNLEYLGDSDEEQISNSEYSLPGAPCPEKSSKRGTKNLITPKLVAALDRCQLSIRDSVYILHAVVEALGLSCDDFPINKSSIQRIRTQTRKSRADAIKTDFQNNVPDVVTVHWDGKLLPGLNVGSSKEERLPIIASFDDREQLLAVPKLESSSGKHQVKAISTALFDWNLSNKVQIMCCETTASNTGRFNGACALLEQNLERELLLFVCRHHVYELVLKAVFETTIKQISSCPDIPIFKNLRDNWKNINSNNIELCLDFVNEYFAETHITSLLMFYKAELDKTFIRDDYRELVELCVVFLGRDREKKLKIKPTGGMHQARWMARAIYSFKICLLQSQFRMIAKDKKALQDVCLFIVKFYVKPWLECTVATKAPNQDLCFLKALKEYEKVERVRKT